MLGCARGRNCPNLIDNSLGKRSANSMDEQEEQALRHRIEELRIEHKDLDDVIARITEEPPFNHLQVQRLKKKKLSIKDEILRLESQLIPDIIA
nr:DUF465 domain-containing protein [Aestuariispira ectoiniformans]